MQVKVRFKLNPEEYEFVGGLAHQLGLDLDDFCRRAAILMTKQAYDRSLAEREQAEKDKQHREELLTNSMANTMFAAHNTLDIKATDVSVTAPTVPEGHTPRSEIANGGTGVADQAESPPTE